MWTWTKRYPSCEELFDADESISEEVCDECYNKYYLPSLEEEGSFSDDIVESIDKFKKQLEQKRHDELMEILERANASS